MSSSPSSFRKNVLPNLAKTFFLLLNVMSSEKFCVPRLRADTVDWNAFFRWVHGQRFEIVTSLLELAREKAGTRLEGSLFTSVFGAVEPKPH